MGVGFDIDEVPRFRSQFDLWRRMMSYAENISAEGDRSRTSILFADTPSEVVSFDVPQAMRTTDSARREAIRRMGQSFVC